MSPAKVYFTNLRVSFGTTLCDKLQKLVKRAGINELPLENNFTAIKMHFGEPGNLAFLRPAYAAAIVELIEKAGGKPYLTDCNTLYVGGRKNALDHLKAAYQNGFTPYATGCQVIIADGLKGTDDVELPVPNGELLQTALIGRGIADSDVIISLSHFKAHEMTGMGGAIKNLGMGCGSRAGKKAMHHEGVTKVLTEYCMGCGRCAKTCAHDAPHLVNKKMVIDDGKCVGCGRCIGVCPRDAIVPLDGQAAGMLDKKIAEYAAAVLKDRPNFHICIAVDISPYCDCHAENDTPILPNIGMFASFDPVALDQACCDMALKAPIIQGSALEQCEKKYGNHFTNLFPTTNWEIQLEHAEKIGIGSRQYELIEV